MSSYQVFLHWPVRKLELNCHTNRPNTTFERTWFSSELLAPCRPRQWVAYYSLFGKKLARSIRCGNLFLHILSPKNKSLSLFFLVIFFINLTSDTMKDYDALFFFFFPFLLLMMQSKSFQAAGVKHWDYKKKCLILFYFLSFIGHRK